MEYVKKNLNKLSNEISLFKREMHLYKKEFIYKGNELADTTQQWIDLLEAYELSSATERDNDYKKWLLRYKSKCRGEEELVQIDESKLKAILVVKAPKVSRIA